MSAFIKFSLVIGFVIYLMSLWSDTKKDTLSPSAKEAIAKTKQVDNERFKAYTDGYILLKKQMKDPSSFDVESACVMPNMTVCYKYRAKNGFGALDLGVAFVTQTSYATSDHKGFNEAFKKECDMSICVSVK